MTTRIAFGCVGLLLGVTGSFGTTLVTANLPQIQGELGISPVEGAWFGAVYMITNIAMNLLLVKYRQQFGITTFVRVFLGLYVVTAVAELIAGSYTTAMVLRAVSGIAGGTISSLTFYYIMQAFPPKRRIQSILVGLGATQIGVPLTRAISPTVFDIGGWAALNTLEAGLALACLACVLVLRLPRGIRVHSFELGDLISFGLLAPGLGLIVSVLSLGRVEWWTDRPWLGVASALGVALITIGWIFEHHRRNPLVDTRWFVTGSFARFVGAIFFVRLLLSEQAVGAPGLLQALNMVPEQTQHLYGLVFVATVAGMLVSTFAFTRWPKSADTQAYLTLALIAIGAWMDAHATVQTHPSNLYISQVIVGFAASIFMGVVLMQGFGHLMKRGLTSLITFVVTFGLTQSLGGLLGGALLGTFQVMRAAHHGSYLAEDLAATNPVAGATVQTYVGAFASTVADPAARNIQGLSTVAQTVTQQANVLAFNDVFWLIFYLALLQIAALAALALRDRWKAAGARSSPATSAPPRPMAPA